MLVATNDNEIEISKIDEIIKNRLIEAQVDPENKLVEITDQLLSGLIAVFIDGVRHAYIVDVRQYPGRAPEEPDTERVIRGARAGVTDDVLDGAASLRRRIKDKHLRNEMFQVGTRSKTDVCISYLNDVANDDYVQIVKEKLQSIERDSIVMADKALEELFIDHKWNPFPLVRYTERHDVDR